MPQKVKSTPGIVNPFTENFMATWQMWLDYKYEVFKFRYKGVHSEQVKLMQLHELAKGDEVEAREIILQSIGEQWSGLFARKNINNGKSVEETRKGVTDVLSQRNYERREY